MSLAVGPRPPACLPACMRADELLPQVHPRAPIIMCRLCVMMCCCRCRCRCCRNDVIMSFLWGMGEHPQLRFRILPVDRFSNIRERPGCAQPACHLPTTSKPP